MHYGIITYGSRGDVQPYIALALGLRDCGHQVTIAAPENFKDFIESYGVGFYALHGNAEEILYSPEGLRVLKTGNAFTLLRYMQKGGKKMQSRINEDALRFCSIPDVLVASVLTNIWVCSMAEKLQKKFAIVQLSQPTTPTKEFPFAGFAFFNAPYYNRFSHKLIRHIYWQLNKKEVHASRASLGLPVLKKSILDKMDDEHILNLYAISRKLIARPKDWESNIDITGFLPLSPTKRENNAMELIPEGMKEWLQAGEKPVYIGFGSMPVPDAELFSHILNEIMSTTELRIVFCKGWSAIPNLPDNPNIFVVKYINHEWLLPQCKAAVIHGGIGTIASCLKAMIPVIVVSVFGDQPWNGAMIANKKLGIHIPFKKVSTKKLLGAIGAVQKAAVIQNVSAIGDAINKENGVRNAVEALERYFGK